MVVEFSGTYFTCIWDSLEWLGVTAVLRWRQWHPTPVLLPGKSHGRRSLVGCSPWSHWGSDTTERLPFHFSLSCIGEGNGNPLQCSCLENPRDRSLVGCRLWGRTESDTTEVTQQQQQQHVVKTDISGFAQAIFIYQPVNKQANRNQLNHPVEKKHVNPVSHRLPLLLCSLPQIFLLIVVQSGGSQRLWLRVTEWVRDPESETTH